MPIKYVDCRPEKVEKVEKVIKGKNGYRVKVTISTTKDCKPVRVPQQQVQKEQQELAEPAELGSMQLELQKIRTHLQLLFPDLVPPFARLLRNLSP